MARKKQPSNHRRHSPLRTATYTDRRTSTAGAFDGELAMSILVDVHRSVGRLDRSVARLEEGQKRLEEGQKRLEERQTNLETKVDLLDANVHQLKGSIPRIEAELKHLKGLAEATKKDVDELKTWKTLLIGGAGVLAILFGIYEAVSGSVHVTFGEAPPAAMAPHAPAPPATAQPPH